MAVASDEVGPGSRLGPLAFSGDDIMIGELLGSGVAGQVYACTRVRTGEQLAVKVIDLRSFSLMEFPEEQTKKLETEVRALREANHERCLGLYDIIRTKWRVLLVTERLLGGELFDRIIAKKRFNECEARYVFRQVVEGLQFLHSKHIVHRDLKPENILVVKSREAEAPESGTLFDVKLADYGLSKFKDTGTTLKSTVGTPQYWAPEVLGSGPYDERVDLWSAGALLYVMLRGQYPFKGNDANADIRAGRFDLSGGNWPKVSDEAKDLVQNLLRVNPSDRLSLEGCLRHRWLGGESSTGPSTIPTNVEMEPSVALVKWEGPEAVGIGEGGSAFSLKELLQLQLSIASSLEMAWLACRHSHPTLALDVRRSMYQASMLAQQALNMMHHYTRVAKQVQERMLPDLALAVKEAEPGLAVELLDMVDKWTKEMQEDGQKTSRLVAELSEGLHNIRGSAQAVGAAAVEQHLIGASSAATNEPPANARVDSKIDNGMTRTAQDLLRELVDFADKEAMTDSADDLSSRRCSKELVDLLFLTPGARPGGQLALTVDAPGDNGGCVNPSDAAAEVDAMSDAKGSPRPEGQEMAVSEEMPVAEAPCSSLLPARASPLYPLLRSQHEIRRVSEILEECNAVWTHMQGTVQELSRLKDHTQALVKFASKSGPLRERFETRFAEYSGFWGSIMMLCQQYCNEAQPALQNMRQLMLKVEAAAETLDAAHVQRYAAKPSEGA